VALQQIAQTGLRATYRASYTAHQAKPSRRVIWRIARTPKSLRIDVVSGRVTATLIVGTHGAFACKAVGHSKICFKVAKPGRPVPAPFDLAPGLFSTNLRALTTQANRYVISAAGSSGPAAKFASTCFNIRARASALKPRVATGTYCFTDTGVLTSVRFATGSSARLIYVSMRGPKPAVFKPYASPTPLAG